MKISHVFLSLIITLLFLTVSVSGKINETPIIQKVTMNIYGDANYANYVPLPVGTVIIAKDRLNNIYGDYVIRNPGEIGSEIGYNDNFEIGVWRNMSDKMNRSMIITLIFTADGLPTKNTLEFKQNENMKFDIIAVDLPPLPTPIPTEIPIITATPVITTIIQTPTPVIIQPTSSEQNIQENAVITSEYIYYGVIGTIFIISAILISGIIISYMMNKTSRDEVLQPGEEWEEKWCLQLSQNHLLYIASSGLYEDRLLIIIVFYYFDTHKFIISKYQH